MNRISSYHLIKKQTDRVREIDLERILLLSNCQKDCSDKKKWHTTQGVLSVTGQQFMNWHSNKGGGGAIDLVMHLMGCRFPGAVTWLIQAFPKGASPRNRLPEKKILRIQKKLKLPPRHDECIPQVIRYLSESRCIPTRLIQNLITTGQLYADSKANAVFILLGKEKMVLGAELRGTGTTTWKGLAPGSNKQWGCFSIKKESSNKVLLCESAIDAISCFIYYPDSIVVSTAGVCSERPWLSAVLNKKYLVYCAFDADQVGDQWAGKMIKNHPRIKRLRPSCKDWNDMLKRGARKIPIPVD